MEQSQHWKETNDVTEHMVRFVCDLLETWGFGVCVSSRCQNEPAEIALQNAVVRTRQFFSRQFRETRPGIRMVVWVIKEVEKQIRATLFQMYADYNCNSDKFPSELPIFLAGETRRVYAHTVRQSKMPGQTLFFKLMSKDYHGEVAKFPRNGLVSHPLPSSQSWRKQWREALWLEIPNDLMNICSRSEVRLIQPERFGENHVRNFGIRRVSKAVLVCPWELRVRTEFDAPLSRQKYITNQMLDQHGPTPALHKMLVGYRITFV